VTQNNRSIWDDLVEVGRDVLDKIDRLLNPDRDDREPARVPVPVRGNSRRRHPDEHSDYNNPYA
jgi:hypothetical protein